MTSRVAIAVWLAFVLASALALPQPPAPLVLLGAAAFGALVIAAGFAAAGGLGRSPSEVVISASPRSLGMRALASSFAGALLGALVLALLVGLARFEPAIGARMAGRAHEPAWRPWALAFESSILEEVVFRLFLMTAVAWAATRLFGQRLDRRAPFAIALVISMLAFGGAHLPAWVAVTAPAAALLVGVVLLNALAGLLLGYVFWRWGLLLAICCHAAADVVVQGLGPRLLG